jgi:hypothetical protein
MKRQSLRFHAGGLLIGYGLQFLAGMTLNLFKTLPKNHPGSTGKEFFSRSSHSLVWALSSNAGWALNTHAYLALVLIIGSIALFIRSLVFKNKQWVWASAIAAFFTLGAFFNGLSFVDYNHNLNSFIMAVCWLAAVSSLAYGLVRFKRT